MWLKAILDHLKGHPGEYVFLLVVIFGAGWQGKALADFWVDERIKAIVQTHVEPLQTQVTSLQADMADIKGSLDELKAQSLKREILEIRTLLCYSPGDRRLLENFEDTQERYQHLLKGQRYEPPGCEILRRPT